MKRLQTSGGLHESDVAASVGGVEASDVRQQRGDITLAESIPFGEGGGVLVHREGGNPAADAGVALLLLAPVLAGIVLYLAGLARLWRRRAGPGVSMARAAAGVAGWSLLTGALTGPLDRLAESSFAVHMVQHMILLAAVPPLLLLSRAGAVMFVGCPAPLATALAQRWRRAPAWRSLLAQALRPSVAALVQTLLLWGWHLPAAIDAAARDDVVHYAMHASLFAAGLLFWTLLSRSLRAPEPAAGATAAWSAGAG